MWLVPRLPSGVLHKGILIFMTASIICSGSLALFEHQLLVHWTQTNNTLFCILMVGCVRSNDKG